MSPIALDHRERTVRPEASTRVKVRIRHESALRLDPRDRNRVHLELMARRTLRLGHLLSPRSHNVHHDDAGQDCGERRGDHGQIYG